jgi:hypothetical protein
MTKVKQPTPQQVREYLARRAQEHTPPPAPDEVRRQLGWELIKVERENTTKHHFDKG